MTEYIGPYWIPNNFLTGAEMLFFKFFFYFVLLNLLFFFFSDVQYDFFGQIKPSTKIP